MRMIVMAAMLATVAAPVSAQPLQTQLSRCLAIPGVLQRLACYDGVARGAGIVAPPVAAAPAYRTQPSMPLPSPAPLVSYAPPPPRAWAANVSSRPPKLRQPGRLRP